MIDGQNFIREAQQDEFAEIGNLLVEAFETTYAVRKPEYVVSAARAQELRGVPARSKDGLVLVAINGDHEIVGTMTLFLPPSASCDAWHGDYSEMRFLAVPPRRQGQGIGEKLMAKAVELTRTRSLKGICIRVRTGLEKLEAYYCRFGFVRDPRGDESKPGGIELLGYRLSI
jgi:predicted N-acetyltransferase YhbS